jgi:hypothetical protein
VVLKSKTLQDQNPYGESMKLKPELINAEYWRCNNHWHRHKTEAEAGACIEKMQSHAAVSTGARRWTKEAYAAVLKQYQGGARKCDIARSLCLSSTRMGQIINKAERLEQNAESTDPLDKLSVRTKNCLMSVGLYTAAAVRAALADGKLDNIPNLGRLSKTEVWRWLDGLS